jgi:uncharacterized damage-inducible protein DinB
MAAMDRSLPLLCNECTEMESKHIAELLQRVMTGDPWHASSVARILEDVTADQAATRPPGNAHSIWELVLHMTGWAREVTARLGGRAAAEPPEGDWPAIGATTSERWQAARSALFAAHDELSAAIRALDASRLVEPVLDFRDSAAGTGLSHYLTVHGIVHHAVYHSGQIAVLKRVLGG